MQELLNLIAWAETRKKFPAAWEVISSFKQGLLEKPLTRMTLDEVIADQRNWRAKFGTLSSAAGAYQIINSTLEGLKAQLGLKGTELFDGKLQDKLAAALLDRRGLSQFLKGTLSATQFGNNLAMEWASFPKLSGPRLGKSHYGDGVNAATITPASVMKVLNNLKRPAIPPVKKESKVREWLNGFVASTAFRYLLTMVATFIATQLGLDEGNVTAILVQLVGVVMAVWGMWESKRSKVVVDGEMTPLKTEADKAAVAKTVEEKVKGV